jgi:hypothetical protein
MKIRLEVDIEPRELHELMGISYLGSLQEGAVKQLAGKLREGVDPRRVLKGVVPEGLLSILSPGEWRDLVMQALNSDEAVEIEKPPPGRRRRKAATKPK